MTSAKASPTVWMNVTTSANWKRPPVGIVRVEQALCGELEKLYGHENFKRCVWLDGQFVEWSPEDPELSPHISRAIDAVLPKTVSFDLARLFLAKAIKKFEVPAQTAGAASRGIQLVVPTAPAVPLRPVFGDVLISVGLDWDQPYTRHFYELNKKCGVKVITCCYDLIPVLFPQYCVGEVAQRFKEYFTQLSWGSTAVLCISNQTQHDYLNLCREIGAPIRPTQVIPLGDNVPGEGGIVSPQLLQLVSEPFVLYVSTIERRKNHEVLYRAYHLLVKAGHKEKLPKLVFVGMPGWGVGELLKDLELDPLTQGLVVQLNHVNDAELNLLYKRAEFCVYPSLYEGWGLPVGEALALGKPVLASAKGSLPEVGGNLVRYVDPWNVQAWADSILELIESPQKLQAMTDDTVKNYEPRKWHDTAMVVKQFIDQLTPTKALQFELTPGYDMSTEVGVHAGGELISLGAEGYLMYGPHRSLPAGRFRVVISAVSEEQSGGSVRIDFVADKGKKVYFSENKKLKGSDVVDSVLADFYVDLSEQVDDFEIRCRTSEGVNLTISKINIQEIRDITHQLPNKSKELV